MNVMVLGGGFPTARYPGNGIFEFDQAKALAEYGHSVVYAAVDLRSIRRWRRWGFDHFSTEGVEVYRCSIPLGRVGYRLLDFCGKLGFAAIYRQIVRRFGKPDVIHAHFGDVAAYAPMICRKNAVPFVITEHNSTINGASLPAEAVRRLYMLYEPADALLAVSLPLAHNIMRYTGRQAIVVPDMVEMDEFDVVERERPDAEVFRFLSAGNLIQRKGFDLLLRAFARLRRKYTYPSLTIMGGGSEETALRQLASDLGISDAVTFSGAYERKEFADSLNQTDCFVLASRGETFGVVYVEAMAAGVPVIATCCGGPESFVTPQDGLLIPTEDVDALAEAMEKMLLNAGDYDSAAIREHTLARFSPQEIARQLTQVYRNLASTEQNQEIQTCRE